MEWFYAVNWKIVFEKSSLDHRLSLNLMSLNRDCTVCHLITNPSTVPNSIIKLRQDALFQKCLFPLEHVKLHKLKHSTMYVVLCMLGTMSYYGCPIRLPEALDGLEAILRSCSIYSTTLYHYYNCVQPKKTRCSQSSCSSSLNRIGARERELSLILLFFKIQLMTV
jgi:hypothetical protein